MTFPLAKFRLLYPAFAAVDDEVVHAAAEQASCLADVNGCKCSEQAWMALTAHVLALRAAGAAGGGLAPGAIASATIDKVSVSFQAAPSRDAWQHWLNTSPYGQQAAALLKACAPAGLYVGGLPERDAFRAVYGSRGGRL